MKRKIFYAIMFVVAIGCAKVNLQTSQPLKVDINMRVDVYQHVAKDVESIQDQIYGTSQKQMNAIMFMEEAYAQESSTMEEAIERRKARRDIIEDYLNRGYIGENKDAYLQVFSNSIPYDKQGMVVSATKDENNDRKIIYKAIADKNSVDVSQTRKVFFDDDYKRAPKGYWFEVYEGGKYIWKQK